MPRSNRPISVTLSEPRHDVDEGLCQRVDEAFADPTRTCRLKRCSSASGFITPGA